MIVLIMFFSIDTLKLTPLWSKEQMTRPEYQIGMVSDMEVYKGRIYIVDKKFSRVAVFDTTGKYIMDIGAPGQAPGEYINLSNIFIRNDTLFIQDNGNSRISLFRISGEYLSSFHIPSRYYDFILIDTVFYCVPSIQLKDGYLIDYFTISGKKKGTLKWSKVVKRTRLNMMYLYNNYSSFVIPDEDGFFVFLTKKCAGYFCDLKKKKVKSFEFSGSDAIKRLEKLYKNTKNEKKIKGIKPPRGLLFGELYTNGLIDKNSERFYLSTLKEIDVYTKDFKYVRTVCYPSHILMWRICGYPSGSLWGYSSNGGLYKFKP